MQERRLKICRMQWESWKEICFLWGETTYIWLLRERSFRLADFRILKKEGKSSLTLMKRRLLFPPTSVNFARLGEGKRCKGRGKIGFSACLSTLSAFPQPGKMLGTLAYILKGTICLGLTWTGISWAFFLCHPWRFSFLQLGNHTRFGKLTSYLRSEKKGMNIYAEV